MSNNQLPDVSVATKNCSDPFDIHPNEKRTK